MAFWMKHINDNYLYPIRKLTMKTCKNWKDRRFEITGNILEWYLKYFTSNHFTPWLHLLC